MANDIMFDEVAVHRYVVTRLTHYLATFDLSYFALATANNLLLIRAIGDFLADKLSVFFRVGGGEIVNTRRSVTITNRIPVFATWFDHYKDALQARFASMWWYTWLSKWSWFRRLFWIQYKTIERSVTIDAPVTITNVCPHINNNWEKDTALHVAFLFPQRFGGYYREELEQQVKALGGVVTWQ